MKDSKFGIMITTKTPQSSYSDVCALIEEMEKLKIIKVDSLVLRDLTIGTMPDVREIVLYGSRKTKAD